MAKRLSIINFKGGVGKTTLAFHLGTGLAWLHNSRVLLFDMDHQSSLSILCLGPDGWQQAVSNNSTVDQIFRSFVGTQQTVADRNIIARSPMTTKDPDYNAMDVVPASLQLDDIEIELTASHQGNAIHSEWNKRTLVCRWIEDNVPEDEYDYILFDCPPATKIISQNAIAASHGYVVPVVPEAMMERGAQHLVDMVRSGIDSRLKALAALGDERTVYVPDTKLAGLVVTRIQAARGGYTDDHSQHLKSLQRRWGPALMEPYIASGAGVSEALASGFPVYNSHKNHKVGGRKIDQQYISLINEIKRRIDDI